MWAKYCEVLDNFFVQSMCIPSGSPMTAAPDIMTSSTSSLQGSRKSSGLRSESHDVKASCICTEFTSCYSSSMQCFSAHIMGFGSTTFCFSLKCTSLCTQCGEGCIGRDKISEREDDISQSESKHHFSLWYLGTRNQSHDFVEHHNLNSVCHHWNDLYLWVLHLNLNLSSKSDFMTVHFKNVPIMIIF